MKIGWFMELSRNHLDRNAINTPCDFKFVMCVCVCVCVCV